MRISQLTALLVCATAATVLSAQDTPALNLGFIDGQVISAATGAPIGSVKLLLARTSGVGKPLSLESDGEGRFIFQDLTGGRYLLFAEAPGYARQAYGAHGNPLSGAVLLVTPGQEIADLVFKLTPAAVISGKVLDEGGKPVAKATVMALQPVYQRGKKEYVPVAGTQSDENGVYRLANLAAGKYLLAAAYRGRAGEPEGTEKAAADRPERNFTTTFFPGAPGVSAAAVVTASAGTETGERDIRMAKVETYHVAGKVADPEKSATAVVWLTPKGTGVTSLATRAPAPVQADGSFEFSAVAPGSYVLNQTGKDGISGSGPSAVVTVAAKNVDGVVLATAGAGELHGEVKVDGQPAGQLNGLQLVLEPADAPVPKPPKAATGEDGKFTFQGVSNGRYFVHVFAPEGLYVKSVRYRGLDASEDAIDVAIDANQQLQIALTKNGAQTSGTVLNANGNPVIGAAVVLIPMPRKFSLYRETTTDQYGSFSFTGIVPGEYRLLAWEEIDPGEYQNPTFLKTYDLKGEQFVLKPADHKTVVLKALPK